MILLDNRTTIALDKVAYCSPIFYRDKYNGLVSKKKPKHPTLNGSRINLFDMAMPTTELPRETFLDRMKRRGYNPLDKWEPVVKVTLCNGHELEFTGKKALSISKAFNKKQYKK